MSKENDIPPGPASVGEAALRAVCEATTEGILLADDKGRVELFSPAAQILFGYTEEEIVGRSVDLLVPVPLRAAHRRHLTMYRQPTVGERTPAMTREVPGLRKDGSEIPLRVSLGRFFFEGRPHFVAVIQDVTEDRRATDEINYLARHDVLTGLLNRSAFEQRLGDLLADEGPPGMRYALLLIDVDQFRLVNDSCGPEAGDALLRQLAMLIRARLRHADTVARLGADEFGVIFSDAEAQEVDRTAEALLRTIRSFLFTWDTRGFDITVSVGLAQFSAGADTLQTALSTARLACRQAKDAGGDRLQRYTTGDRDLVRRHGEMHRAAEIATAVDENRFRLYAQPILPLQSGHTCAHQEVLVRMCGATGESLAPDAFLPAAERYVLMPIVDRWIVTRLFATCAPAIREWATGTRPRADFLYSVNLSGQSLGDEGFLRFLLRQFSDHGVPFDAICFEITETAAVANLDAARATMRELKGRGCSIALDDFGSGLSSFRYLKALPLDYLKIDGNLVRDITRDHKDHAMVSAINQLGHAMGLKTIAEWVEHGDTAEELRRIGVDYAQGYAFGEPRLLDSEPPALAVLA